jgi:hypothetical protein
VTTIYPDLPNWTFEIREVSANVYTVTGKDNLGHELRGNAYEIDLDKIVEQCKDRARVIDKQRQAVNKS